MTTKGQLYDRPGEVKEGRKVGTLTKAEREVIKELDLENDAIGAAAQEFFRVIETRKTQYADKSNQFWEAVCKLRPALDLKNHIYRVYHDKFEIFDQGDKEEFKRRQMAQFLHRGGQA